jgi:hypothetical protein
MGPMPIAVSVYLRHLATRCSRLSRDCTDHVVSRELEQIGVELVEKAEILEAHFSISQPTSDSIDFVEIRNIDDEER